MADVAKASLAVTVGERLVRGVSLAELERSQTTESPRTVKALVAYAAGEGLELPRGAWRPRGCGV